MSEIEILKFLCLVLYVGVGVWFMYDLAQKTSSFIYDFTKGDVVLGILFFPFTLFVLLVCLLIFLYEFIRMQLKFTIIANWWKSPIRKEDK